MCNLVKQDTGINVENISKDEIVNKVKENNLLSEEQKEGLDIKEITKGELIVSLFEAYSEKN